MEGFSKQEPELDKTLRPMDYKQGDVIEIVVKEIPTPTDILPSGKPKFPVGFIDDFIVIVTSGLPKDTQVGDRIRVTLLKVARSYSHKQMGFGAYFRGE